MNEKVVLGSGGRKYMLSLKQAQSLREKTENRLSSGLKVRSAIDDPAVFFQAKSLSNRANDLLELKSGIDQTISTLKTTLAGIDSIKSVVKQMKGLVLSAAGKGEVERTSLATQFDEMRQQVNTLATDTLYNGTAMIGGSEDLSVELSPNGNNQLSIAGKDLRVNDRVINEDISTVWLDDRDGVGSYSLATRSFDGDLSAISDETIGSTVVSATDGIPVKATRMIDGGTATAYVREGGQGIGLKILASNGQQVCSDVLVSTVSFGQDVTALNDGRIAVSMVNLASGLSEVSVYAADGTLETTVSVPGSNPSLTNSRTVIGATADGGFTVSWREYVGVGDEDVYSCHFNDAPSAVTGAVQVNQTTATKQIISSVTGLTGGGAVITWTDDTIAPSGGVVARMTDASGALSGNEFRVDGNGVGGDGPQTSALADGGFVIAWGEDAGGPGGWDIRAVVYNANGSVRVPEFAIISTGATEASPSVSGLPSGGFAVSWLDNSGTDGSSMGCYMATFDADGNAGASATMINQSFVNDQGYPVIAKRTLSDLVDATGTSAGLVTVRKAANYNNFDTATNRAMALRDVTNALAAIDGAAGHFISNMSLLQVRLDYTQHYSGTLSAGADKLTLADINEEGANLLALQMRTQLGQQALSFFSQTQQSILSLFN